MNAFSKRIANLSPEKRKLFELLLREKGVDISQSLILPQGRESDTFPLSFGQERLWFLEQLVPGNPMQNVSGAALLTGTLNIESLEQTISEIIRRHEILRTTFSVKQGKPVQVISPPCSFSLPVVDRSEVPDTERETEVQKLATDDARKPFDMERGPLFRVTLVRLGSKSHGLLLTLHHIICDGWSIGVFIREIMSLYDAFSAGTSLTLPELPVQYADFAVWQRQWLQGGVLETQLSYWKQQLGGTLPVLEMPTDYPRPAIQSFRGKTRPLTLPPALSNALRELSREEEVTPFMMLLAVFKTLLHRYTHQEDILVGTAIANRSRAETEGLIGFIANTLILRTDLSCNPSFRELLKRVRNVCLDAYAHQELPFELIVNTLQPERDLSHMPLFQVLMVQQPQMPVFELEGLQVKVLEVDSQASAFDLSLSLQQSSQHITGALTCSTDLFAGETINRMAGHFQCLLEGIVSNPDQTLSELPILTEAEQRQLLVTWNDTRAEYPENMCIHQLFEAQVGRTPDSTAVIFAGEKLTYRELNCRANQLAHHLKSLGVGPEKVVGMCVERSLEMVVGILAILKAGGAYVPLDPNYPEERISFMLEDTRASVLLTQEHLADKVGGVRTPVIVLGPRCEGTIRGSGENPPCESVPENLVYVIYTSGSTGHPKGVLISHKSVVNAVTSFIRTYVLGTNDKILQQTSLSFDVSVNEIFPILCAGGTLVIPVGEEIRDLEKLTHLISSQEITIIGAVPSVLAQLNTMKKWLQTVRLILSGGETLRLNDVDNLLASTTVTNGYGPTETTICSVFCNLNDFKPSALKMRVPIGRPIANTQIYLLDNNRKPVPVGIPGELHIGGVGLARGYLNQPELTAERFVPNHFSTEPGARLYKTGDLARYRADGTIEFLGRIDNQVKIRGFRIEPGEIETVLREHPKVGEAAVVVQENETGDKRLVAYIVPNQEPCPAVCELRGFAKEKLPSYMVPSAFVMLDALPLTASGKVDKKALPEPEITRPVLEKPYVAPRTPLETRVAEMWMQLLGVSQVGIHDNFFDLGGHSLLATQLVATLRDAFQVDLSLLSVFEAQTVAELAETIEAVRQSGDSTPMTRTDLEAEATLDPSIFPKAVTCEPAGNPSHIFLTGATGFLGTFLLHELLEQTQADIHCLVRTANREEGKKKIQRNLESFSLWNEDLHSRIHPVAGDLSEPLLGLSKEQFGALATTIDAVYHNGALVNLLYPYSLLKAPNVLGTREVLRLAGHVHVKPLHYISTVSVFPSTAYAEGGVITEGESIDNPDRLFGGYAQSKWVAEQLVAGARAKGLPLCIYRPGMITGHSRTGASNGDELIFTMIQNCIHLGSAPDMEMSVGMTPVDYVSEAIVHLSRQKASLGKPFHLVNPRPISWNELVRWIRSYGYPLKHVPLDRWLEELGDQTGYALGDVLSPLIQPSPRFDCRNTLNGLAGTSIMCPPVDYTLLGTYFSFFISKGLLDPPPRKGEPEPLSGKAGDMTPPHPSPQRGEGGLAIGEKR